MSTVAQPWLMSIVSGFLWGTQEMVASDGQCNIDFQIWIDAVFKITPEECNLFPLNAFSNHWLRTKILFYFPSSAFITPWSDLLIWVFIDFLPLVEFKLHAGKDLVFLSWLPLYSFLVPQAVARTSAGLSTCQNTLMLGHQKDKQRREQRMEQGSVSVTLECCNPEN